MTRLRFSPSSRRDLIEILDHIAHNNPEAAANFVKKIKDSCSRIARYPKMGIRRDDLAPGLRCLPVANYLIFYRETEGCTDIVRVLHGSRDYRNLMK